MALRFAPIVLAAILVLCTYSLARMGKLEDKFMTVVTMALPLLLGAVARQMMLPSATTTTKEVDPSGTIRETKVQAPLGVPPAPAVVIPPVKNGPPTPIGGTP